MTTLGALALAAWLLASGALFLTAAARLADAGSTVLERIALASAAAVFVPPLVAQWMWFVPADADVHVALSALVCSVAAVTLHPRRRAFGDFPTQISVRCAFDVSLVVVLALLVIAYSVFMAVLKPVDEWDALMYHGPTTVKLVTEHSLFDWNLGSSFGFYPNLTAFMGAPVVNAIESTRFLDSVEVAPWACIVLVGWAWAGRGRPGLLPGIVVLFAATAPPLFVQLRTLAADVTYASGLLTAAYAASLWWNRRGPEYASIAVIGMAVAVAAKPAGALYVVWVAVLIVVVAAIRRRRRWVHAAVLTTVAALAGSPVYLRNLIEFHNPAYPVEVEAGPVRLPGIISSDVFYAGTFEPRFGSWPPVLSFFRNLIEGVVNPPAYYSWDPREGTYFLWPLWLALLAIGAVVVLARRRQRPALGAAAVVALTGVLVGLLSQPQSWYPRYVIGVFMLLAIGTANLVGRAVERRGVALAMALTLVVIGAAQLRHVEHRFNAGFGAIERERVIYPGYGDTFGNGATYGPGFAEVASAPCGTNVLVDANDLQTGRYSTMSLGLFGDRLCNDVRFVDQGQRPLSEALSPFIDDARFVVVDEPEIGPVTELSARAGRLAVPIAGPLDLNGQSQVILRLDPGT